MSDAAAPLTSATATAARPLHFDTEEQALAQIRRLRAGYAQTGNWTLAQMAWHLVIPLEQYLNPPVDPDQVMSEKQLAMKERFVDYICRHDKLPPHANTAPPSWTPPASADDTDIARLETGLHRLKDYAYPRVEMGPIGPISIAEARRVHLVHLAHHLGFLTPRLGPRAGLTFHSEAAVIADVNHLRRGYVQFGNWTLEQACWHLATILEYLMTPADGPVPPATPEQTARLHDILSTGKITGKIDAPPQMLPPVTADDSDIERFIAMMTKVQTYTGEWRPHRIFGPIAPADYRRLTLVHAAHHLSNLVPTDLVVSESKR